MVAFSRSVKRGGSGRKGVQKTEPGFVLENFRGGPRGLPLFWLGGVDCFWGRWIGGFYFFPAVGGKTFAGFRGPGKQGFKVGPRSDFFQAGRADKGHGGSDRGFS